MTTICKQERDEIATLYRTFGYSTWAGKQMAELLRLTPAATGSRTRRWEYRGVIERAERPEGCNHRQKNWWKIRPRTIENMRLCGALEAHL